jgi:hypothetical protein
MKTETTQARVSGTLDPIVRRCIGYGPHEGKCENEAGTPWGPHWCMRCDKIRLATISKNLTDIVNAFPSNAGTHVSARSDDNLE